MEEQIYVPVDKYREMQKKSSSGSISENGTCQTFFWQNAEYISTGSAWQYHECLYIHGYRVEDFSTYTGDLKPLKYEPHWGEVRAGNRERCYNGMLVMCGKRQLVIVGKEITFLKLEVGQQLKLF